MIRKLCLRAFSLILLSGILILPHVTLAQSQNSIVPSNQSVRSPGQVDMRSGFFQHERVDAAIGPNENGDGLVLVRTHAPYDYSKHATRNIVWGGPFSMTHNWSIRLYENMVWSRVVWASGSNPLPLDFDHREGRPAFDVRFNLQEGPSTTIFDLPYPRAGAGIPSAGTRPARAFLRNDGGHAPLGDLNGTYSWWAEKEDGTRIDFSTLSKRCGEDDRRCAVAQSITQPNGTRYDLTYISRAVAPGVTNDLLETVTSNRGYGLKFFYNFAVSDQPTKACLFNTVTNPMPTNQSCNSVGSTEVTYAFSGLSFEAHTPVGRSERIVSTAASGARDISFYNGDDTTPWMVNSIQSGADVVNSQVLTGGQTYTYNYVPILASALGTGGIEYAGGSYTDAEGNTMEVTYEQIRYPINPEAYESCGETRADCLASAYAFQVPEGPTRITDQLGRVSTANYCDPWLPPPNFQVVYGGSITQPSGCVYGKVQSVTAPGGNKTEFRYAGGSNIVELTRRPKLGTGLQNIIEARDFGCPVQVCKHKPTAATDGNGNTTNWEYSTVHGQLLSETLPPDASGVRPQTRYTYQQKYAWLNNGSSYIQAATPIWLLVSEEYCRTSSADSNGNCSAGAADEVITTYEYETGNTSTGSNLHLLGAAVTAGGETLRTCYQYDDMGRRIAGTQPLGTGAFCS